MNKTVQINLGGHPFIIDENGFDFLEDYLNSLSGHFEYKEDGEEIIGDIETRMAELLQDKLKTRRVVSLSDMKEIVAIMGYPKDFEDEQPYKEDYDGRTIKTGRRLFRNTEDKVFGGVCSGLSAYFGIEDPIWMRLAFAILSLGAGIGLIPYLILWIALPEAKTPAEKIAMKGERIDVSNIVQKIEEDIEFIKQKLTDIGEGFKGKKKDDDWFEKS